LPEVRCVTYAKLADFIGRAEFETLGGLARAISLVRDAGDERGRRIKT